MTESIIHRMLRRTYDTFAESITGEITSRNNTRVENCRGTQFFNSSLPYVAENIRCPNCRVHMKREVGSYWVVNCDYHGDGL